MSLHDLPLLPLNILVVDDADTGDSMAELLTLCGHTVRVARGGEDALRQAAADPPDVALLDVRMPRVDGCEVARALSARVATAKRPLLIAITGCVSAADRSRTAAAGFDLHLIKPVEPAVLYGVLERFRRFLASTVWYTGYDPPPAEPPASGISRRHKPPPLVPSTKRPDAPSPDSEELPVGAIRVLLADDHAVVREGLKALVCAEPDMDVVGEAADGLEAVALVAERDPDVVVVDVSMPGLNGAQVTARVRQERPDRRVLALTVHEDASYLRLLLEAGAAGYVLKRAAPAELVRAIRAVAAGGTYLDPALAGRVADDLVRPPEILPTADLSERETEVVRFIALGYSNKEIAARLKLSVKTVETYKTRSMEKLNIRSRVDIVRYAAGRGWLANA